MNKAELRKQFLALRRTMTPEENAAKSMQICHFLEESDLWQKAQNIMFYAPLKSEVNVFPLMEKYLNEKNVFLPCIETFRSGESRNLIISDISQVCKQPKYDLGDKMPDQVRHDKVDVIPAKSVCHSQLDWESQCLTHIGIHGDCRIKSDNDIKNKSDNNRCIMHAHRVQDLQDLRKNSFNIYEACPIKCPRVSSKKIDLVLVPAVAVDKKGNRIGFGKGYYDRFLAKTKSYNLAIVFASQILDKIPAEKHDVSVDAVCSEDGLLYI